MKERKKRKKFNIKRTLVYLATYIVVTFGVALFMVMNTSTTLSSGNKFNFTIPEPSAIEKVISSITDNENIEMTASIDVDKDGEPFAKVLFGANVNFGDELTDIKVAADMNATYGDHTITAQARYIDNELYLSLLGGNYKLNVPTAMDAISSVTNLLGVDLDKELSALDTSALAELAADVQEIEDGYIVSLEFNGIQIKLITDANYNLVSAKISDIEVDGYVIKIKANVVARNNGKVVEAPQDEYVDITDTFAIVESISNTLTNDMFVSAHVAYGDLTFDGYINFANLNAFGTLSADEVEVDIQYKDGFVYADALGAKVKVALADYEKYLDALSAFGIDINVNVDANHVLDMVTSLSLDVIKSVERIENSVVVTLTSDETIVFDVTGNKLNRITASVGGADAEIALGNGSAVAPAINEEEYIDAVNFLPYVDSIAQIVESKNIAGNITLKFDENEYLFNVRASFEDEFSAQATGNVFGLQVVVTYANENVYLDIDDAHIVLHKNQFSELLDLFEVDTQLDLGDLDIALSMQDSKIMASVLGYTFGICLDSNNIVLNANISGLELSASVGATNESVVLPTGEYHELDIVAIASQVKDILDSKSFSADISANFMDTTIDAHAVVNFEDGISAQISGIAFDKEFVITLQDGVLYVSIDDSIKLQGALQDLPQLIDEIKTAFAGNTNSVGALDIASSLALKYNGSNFVVALGDFEVFVNVENGIGNVSMQSEQFSVQLTPQFDTQEIVEKVTDIESYDNNVLQFVSTISAINYLINSEHIHGIAQVYIDGELHEFTLHVQHEDSIKACVSGKLLDKEFKLTYANNLYVNALGLSYYITSEDMSDIFNGALALVDELPLDIESMQITNFVVREDVVYVVINNEIYVQLILNGGRIDNIQINYNNIDAYIYLNYETQIEINEPSVSSYIRLTEQFDVVNLLDLAHDLIENKQVQISASVNVKEYQLTIDAKVDFANELVACVNLNVAGYDITLNVQNGTVYVNVQDMIYLYGNLSELPDLISNIMSEFGVNTTLDDVLDYVTYLSITNNVVVFNYDNISAQATLCANNESVNVLSNVDKYTNNILDVLPYVKAVKTILDANTIGATADVQFGDKELEAHVTLDKADKFKVLLTTQLLDEQLSVTYANNTLYISFAGLNYYLADEDIDSVLQKINELELLDIDTSDITIDNFVLSSEAVSFTINDLIDIELNVQNDVAKTITLQYEDLLVKLSLDYSSTSVVEPSVADYTKLTSQFALCDLIDLVTDVLDTKQAVVSASVSVGELQFAVNALIDFSDSLVAQATLSYDNYKVDVYVQDGKVYVNALDSVYLYDNLNDLPILIEDIMQLFEVEQLSIEDLLDEVQYVSYTSGKLQYVHGDIEFVASISATNESVVKLDDVSAYANKISDLLPFISATKTLIEAEHIGANAQVSFDGSKYNATLGYTNVDDKISATLATSIKEKQITLTYLENVIYANVFGYKASFDLDNAQPLLDKVFEMLKVENLDELLEKYDLSMDFDINSIISSFKLTPGKLELTIADKFEVVLNVANDLLDNIQFTYNDISASIVLDFYTPVEINVVGEYDSLNDKVEILDHAQKLIDTYNAIASEYVIDGETYIGYNASFDASVRFGNTTLEGNIQASLVPTKVEDKVENKLYASVYGSFGTLDAKIYLADNVAYVNIQGLKIKVELSKDEIDNILAWVNDKFDKELAFDSLSDGITFEIPDLSTLQIEGNASQLFVGLGELKVNTTKFTDIVVKLNSGELLDDIIIATNVYDNNITEIGSDDFENADWENADTIHKNLAFHLSNFTYDNFVNTITLGDTMLLGGVAQSEFVDYSKVLNFVDALIEYANSGEYAFTLNAIVNEYNPATNQTKLYAKAQDAFFEIHNAKNGTTESKINIDYLYASGTITLPNNAKNRTSDYLDHKFSGVLDSRNGDNKLYATYSNSVSNFKNSLKLKIDTNTLMYFASIVLKLFDVETQSGIVSKFANLPNVDDLDVSNLRNLVGVEPVDVSDFEQIDNLLSKAKDYIDKVKSIEFVNRVVNGKEENYLALNIEINDEIMELRINTLDGILKYIGAENVQVTRARNMNLTLDVTEFKGTNNYNKSASHFDLTSLKDLVTSFVNNSKYNDFHITGTLDVSITLAGIIPITLNVPLDAKIKLVDKKPQVMINLTIPVLHPLYNVNDDMNSWSSERTVKIYYADGYLYTYRTEKSGKYEKKVKQELATLGDSIMDYVQYITGLNDDIMSKISEAMDKTINRTTPIDFTDVISNYSYTSSSSAHNITINLKELANNDQLDTATLKLYTSYLNSAKYIQKAELDVEMPVATGVNIAIKALSSSGSKNPLKLVDIGSTVNMSELTNYINSYTYNVDEFWVKNNGGSWKKESDQEYTITFDSLGGASVGDITNKAGTPITLPRISSNKTNTVDNIQYIYSFVGWTLDSMGAGEIVSWSTQPRGNKTLYAVWNIIDTKTLITFVTNSDYSVSSIRASVGTNITLPTISGVKNVDGTSERKEYTFAGWYYDSGCTNAATITTMPSTNVTLFAKWVLSRTVNIYTVTFVSNGATTYNSIKVEAGSTLSVSGYTPHKHDTTEWKKEKENGKWYEIAYWFHYHTHYTFAGWYTNSGLTSKFNGVVNGNITLYGKYTTNVTRHKSDATLASLNKECDDSCEWC